MHNSFVHLHLHTEYSLVDGLLRIGPLMEATAKNIMPALAVTEQGNLFSMVKFYRQAQSYGIKPIIGAELKIREHEGDRYPSAIVLLCQNLEGYHCLTRLITKSYTDGQYLGVPHIERNWLSGNTDGLIALSSARGGNIGKAIIARNTDQARHALDDLRALFPDRFYLELQRTGRQDEDIYIDEAIKMAQSYNVPVVATNDVRFLSKSDFDAHEARVCIQQGYRIADPHRPIDYSDQQYLKSPAEMHELFSDIPEAIENTVLIAKRCNLKFDFGDYFLPDFPVPQEHDQDSWLKSQSEVGFERIMKLSESRLIRDKEYYRSRLDHELNVIIEMGYSGYFLIVADFIRWAKQNEIPVGPGRGSGAGSLVAYVLGITELDPIEFNLLFERFLNPERVSLPDFDIDFCMEKRDRVIEYVAQQYGHDHVSQIITFGRMAAKAVIRDVGRVLNHPYGFVDQIAKLIPFDLNMTLDIALKEEELLKQRYDNEEDVKEIIDLAKRLEGISRNAGKHAGGIVIAPKPLTEYMPLYCEQGTTVTSTQFDMGDVEAMGLIKFDFLGLRTLTIIDWAVKDINTILPTDQEINILNIPLDDKETFQLIQRMDTTAVFQLESDGIKKLIKQLHPDKFDDLIALVALFRPGPLQSGMVDSFIERKHGKAMVNYPHPSLEEILKPTYGVILYQEQVMQIAQELAGYSLGSADLLRRAMGKKKPEEMAEQRNIFVDGAVAKNISKKVATGIFDLMEKFAGYGFNKSHSAAYALLAYQTAWLKAKYPAAFMASVLSSDMDNTDKIVSLRAEVKRMNIRLDAPAVNNSEYKFTVKDSKTVQFGLGAIKGIGLAAIEHIVNERNTNGMYKDLFDLCRRLDSKKVNKRVLEVLIKSGAVDDLGPNRSVMIASLPRAMRFSEQLNANTNTGQDDMFGLGANSSRDKSDTNREEEFIEAREWDDEQRLRGEKDTLGFYLRGHPIGLYENELSSIITTQLNSISLGNVRVAGYIENIRTRSGRRGRMAEIRIDDRTTRAHVNVYSDVYQQYRSILQKDTLVIIFGEAVQDEYYSSGYSIKANRIFDLAGIRSMCSRLILRIDKSIMQNGLLNSVQNILKEHTNGKNTVNIQYNNGNALGSLQLGEGWQVEVNDKLIEELTGLLGSDHINIEYKDFNRNFSNY